MTKTGTATFDNLSAHALVVPIACKAITIREQATTFTSDYRFSAPSSTDPQSRKLTGEPTQFAAGPGGMFEAGVTVGFIQPINGTMTFSFICE
jgi:hypothetical protein